MHEPWHKLCLAIALAVALTPGTVLPAEITAIGVKGGLSAAREYGDFAPEKLRLGVGAGVFASVSVTRRFALQPELLFVMKGGKFPAIDLTDSGGGLIAIGEVTHSVDYLEIPVLARFTMHTSGRVSPTFLAGPSLAFKLSEQARYDAPVFAESHDLDTFLDADLGVAIGAGVEIGRGRDRVVLEVRYTGGVINAMNSAAALGTRNGAFLIMAGYSMQR